MSSSSQPFVVAALYQFVRIHDVAMLRERLLHISQKADLKGTLLVAAEGLNGTVAGSRGAIKQLCAFLREDGRFDRLEYKESYASEQPFLRMKVKLKREIVTLGIDDLDPNSEAGTHVAPEDWNALISDPGVTLVDTRNDYEVQLGTFEGAINPETEAFRDFPAWVDEHLDPATTPKVAMFCTGGIRCEKSTALLKRKGFKEVYHLHGGILKYLENVPQSDSLWRGDCFVFDDRVSVDHGLREGDHQLCPACRHPVSAEDLHSERYLQNVCCPHCHDKLSEAQKASVAERLKQIRLAKERGEQHIGQDLAAAKARKQQARKASREQ
jgi:UPF0176 protein